MMIDANYLENFFKNKDYDIRKSHNARWIDQKCTPDVLWSISDFVLNYVDNVKSQFTTKDIWKSDYARMTIAETYSKPETDEAKAESEYDKVFSQPLSLLCYAGVIRDISASSRHLYEIENRDVLKYIATNDVYALRFLQAYVEKVLKDSAIFCWFEDFFNNQDKAHFNVLKSNFIKFYHDNTPVKKDFEPKRIFTKVINPLAHKYNKLGSENGRMSKNKIKKADMMYNQDNFRDIYEGKPKDITRKEWLETHPKINLRLGYFEQMLTSAKSRLKESIRLYRDNISELTQFSDDYKDNEMPTQIHHIFPKNEFPEIKHYLENLIALTPNQHYSFAHPNNNTQYIDLNAQKILLVAKTSSIKENLTSKTEEHIYEFANLLYVLHIGLSNDEILTIKDGDYAEVLHFINCYYANV